MIGRRVERLVCPRLVSHRHPQGLPDLVPEEHHGVRLHRRLSAACERDGEPDPCPYSATSCGNRRQRTPASPSPGPPAPGSRSKSWCDTRAMAKDGRPAVPVQPARGPGDPAWFGAVMGSAATAHRCSAAPRADRQAHGFADATATILLIGSIAAFVGLFVRDFLFRGLGRNLAGKRAPRAPGRPTRPSLERSTSWPSR